MSRPKIQLKNLPKQFFTMTVGILVMCAGITHRVDINRDFLNKNLKNPIFFI